MDPVTMSLATLQKGFELGIALVNFWQTPVGQKHFQMMLDDRAQWDAFWANIGAPFAKPDADAGIVEKWNAFWKKAGDWTLKLVTGDLLKLPKAS